ncbi:MAG: histidine kinase N-terminal 7TM domain-containing protein [bacterium]
MNILFFIHCASVAVFLSLMVFILARDFRSPVHRAVAATMFCFALWSFSLIFIHNPLASMDTVIFYYNVGVIGWATFGSCTLYFVLQLTQNYRWLNTKWLRAVMVAWPIAIVALQWRGWLAKDYILRSWGWGYQWTDSPLAFAFYLSYVFFIGLTIDFLYDFSRETTDKDQKAQLRIIVYTAIISLALGILTDVLLPILNIYSLPNMAPDFVVIWAFGSVYAVVKEKLRIKKRDRDLAELNSELGRARE